MNRVWGLRLAFIGVAIAVAILVLRDTLTEGFGENSRGEYIGYSPSQDWIYSILHNGWGLVAAALVSLFGLYRYISSKVDH